MTTIAAYVHSTPAVEAVEPDPRPGSYYVSCIDGPRRALLYGPLPSHAAALAMVDQVRAVAVEVDARAHWYSFGTARADVDYTRPGVLNEIIDGAGGAHGR